MFMVEARGEHDFLTMSHPRKHCYEANRSRNIRTILNISTFQVICSGDPLFDTKVVTNLIYMEISLKQNKLIKYQKAIKISCLEFLQRDTITLQGKG